MRRGNRIIPNGRFQTWFGCACSSSFWIFICQTVAALDYTEVAWGFDGRAVPDQFNLLTVVVRNSALKPFDGVVKLEQGQGFAVSGGTEIEPCYLDPGGARTLQFYPRITGTDGWRLSDGEDTLELDPPKEGIPAVVRLIDGEDPLQRSQQIKAFAYQRFPTMVGGAGALYAAVVDDVPGFSPSQKIAFIDWLLAGGRLHIFLNRESQFADLNHPMLALDEVSLPSLGETRTRTVGNGIVVWHGKTVANLTAEDVSSFEPEQRQKDGSGYYVPVDMSLFQELQQLTRPNVAWPLVYLAAILYIGLLGPGHYLWVRKKKRDYRVVLAVLLATVAVFGLLFAWIGRRGYGEKTQVSTVSLARHIAGTRYDVTSWGNLFVTAGDTYELRHPSTHNLYSTGESYESVNATTMSGREGRMQTEIPVFSSRTFVHRGTLDGLPPPVLLSDTGADDSRTISWQLPESADVNHAWVRIRNGAYTAAWDASRRRVTFIGAGRYRYPSHYHSLDPYYGSSADSDQLFYAGRKLLHHTLGLGDEEDQEPGWVPPLDAGMVELFLLTSTPESFHLTGQSFAVQQGATLYRYLYQAAPIADTQANP